MFVLNNQLVKEIYNLVEKTFQSFWDSTENLKNQILVGLKTDLEIKAADVIVSGESNNLTAYILLHEEILVFCPKEDLRLNPLLKRWDPQWFSEITEETPINFSSFNKNEKLLIELELPRYLLINLSIIENFPIPRLNLSIGTLASYLRKKQIAHVEIIDMQTHSTVEDIINRSKVTNPDLIGMSINFGQKNLAFEILDSLFSLKNNKTINSLLVVGNVIPALAPEELLNKYPELLIANREGEYTLEDLAGYFKGEYNLKKVRGILYKDPKNNILVNPVETVNILEVPTPALDTIKEISAFKGALTLEASRGCDYSLCTFCPRDHKLRSWRPMSTDQVLQQIDDLIAAGDSVGIKRHIYFADEEFIGELPDGSESDRIIEICKGIIKKPYNIKFDFAARADSVYDHRRDDSWNIERLKMWHYCVKAGTDRVFIGVESGSTKQLKRFGKGTTPEQNIIALRFLSALGINLRIGFIMFDQMMNGVEDLVENLEFLERTDALMNPIPLEDMSYEELYYKLLNDEDFINQHKLDQPVYSIVSYMLASMEVLMNTPYSRLLKNTENKENITLILNEGDPDTNMGRYATKFYDPFIGSLSDASQKWIDSNFGLMYTVKSLYKVATNFERELLYGYMVEHREISQYLLKFLLHGHNENTDYSDSILDFVKRKEFNDSYELNRLILTKENSIDKHNPDTIYEKMNFVQKFMLDLVKKIENDLTSGNLTDSQDFRLRNTIAKWYSNQGQWALINSYN